jgi:hypothetical protein
MKASTGRTFGLIFVILIILAAVARLSPLVVAPLGVFSGLNRAFSSTVHGLGRFGVESVFGGALVVFWIFVLFWVYRDAERRGMSGVLWALLVFIGNLIGLIIYLIVRNENRGARTAGGAPGSPGPAPHGPPACPKCGKPADDKHAFCPYCGENLRPVCPRCGKSVESTWRACAFCGEKLKG